MVTGAGTPEEPFELLAGIPDTHPAIKARMDAEAAVEARGKEYTDNLKARMLYRWYPPSHCRPKGMGRSLLCEKITTL